MEEFNALYVNSYTISQLADFINNGKASLEEIYQAGLLRPKRDELENELRKREEIVSKDDESWDVAQCRDTILSYRSYLMTYDKQPPEYRGKYVKDAYARIDELGIINRDLKNELLQDMRDRPSAYPQTKLETLCYGADERALKQAKEFKDVYSRFLVSGQTLTEEDLWEEELIPRSLSLGDLLRSDVHLQATQIEQLGDFPQEERTDVYFLGVPRSGKSTMMAGLFSCMDKEGLATYQPHYNVNGEDLARSYYYGLIRSTRVGRFPESTSSDTISFMKIDLRNGKHTNRLNFVEMAGEAFRKATMSGLIGKHAWEGLGAGQCLRANNRKLLFFVIDYGIKSGLTDVSMDDQWESLTSSLNTFTSDGVGRDGMVSCTMSKVDTVAIIVTKCDLIKGSDEEKWEKVNDFVDENYSQFKNDLRNLCRKYGINKPTRHEPYIMPFSQGEVGIGNRYSFNPKDSRAVVDFISQVTTREKGGFLSTLFG